MLAAQRISIRVSFPERQAYDDSQIRREFGCDRGPEYRHGDRRLGHSWRYGHASWRRRNEHASWRRRKHASRGRRNGHASRGRDASQFGLPSSPLRVPASSPLLLPTSSPRLLRRRRRFLWRFLLSSRLDALGLAVALDL